MKNEKPASTTATSTVLEIAKYLENKGLVAPLAVVSNNQRPILGTFTDEETLALGALLDRLDGLERAIRVRPNAKALAALRESIAFEMEMDGDPESRLAGHAAAILLDMLDKIVAVPK